LGGCSYILEIFQEILNWAKENLTREEVNKLFLPQIMREGRSFIWEHVSTNASFSWNIQLCKENLTREEVNKLFLSTDNEGRTVFYVGASFNKREAFEGILNFAKRF
jgi:endo-1,4-beta-D-glucanase Y